MVDKSEWGPVVWRLLHTMADISCRKDIYLLWASVLRNTASVLPCNLCRTHMKSYLETHAFVPNTWMKQTGSQNRDKIRVWISDLHNSVNERLGKPRVELRTLPVTPFQTAVKVIQESYAQLQRMWVGQKMILGEWKRNMDLLIQLLFSGPD